MYEAIENGEMNPVPLIIGMCSEEELIKVSDSSFPAQLGRLDENVENLVPRNMHLTDENLKKTTGETIRKFYTEELLKYDIGAGVRYFTDSAFSRGIIRHAQLQSKFSDVWFYYFNYHGQLGGNVGPFFSDAELVHHGEDLSYIWAWYNGTWLNSNPENDILTSERYRTLITNFAKYGNPTPNRTDLLNNISWPTVRPNDFQYLEINTSLSIKENPKGEIYSKWLDLYETVAVKPFDTF
ncbi:hypothetical protein JTB14_030711 [Gonioctena quinquepunctata]|nr:hypothetical protein JTB14_030711 [Gonioctena quinquepunctata]